MNSSLVSALFVRNDGKVGIGTTAPDTNLTINANATALPAANSGTILHLAAADGAAARLAINAFGGAPIIDFFRADNIAATPSPLQADERIFGLMGTGYGATGYSATPRVAVNGYSSQIWTDAAQGTYLNFETTANGSVLPTERMRIDNAGNVGIGTTSPDTKLHIVGALHSTGYDPLTYTSYAGVSTASQGMFLAENTAPYVGNSNTSSQALYGAIFHSIITSTNTNYNTNSVGFVSQPTVDGSAAGARIGLTGGQIIVMRDNANDLSSYASNGENGLTVLTGHYNSLPATAVSGSAYGVVSTIYNTSGTITNAYGFYNKAYFGNASGTANPVIGTYYGLRLLAPTFANGGTITTNYGISQEDAAANNFFAGNVGIGTTSPGVAKLNVQGLVWADHSATDTILDNTVGDFQGSAGYWRFRTGANYRLALDTYNSAWQESVSVLRNGNVGIGTTSPGAKLEITNDGGASPAAYVMRLSQTATNGVNTDSNTLVDFYHNNGSNSRDWKVGTGSNTLFGHPDNFGFYDTYASKAVMVLTSTDRVGIGTTSPGTALEVDYATPQIFLRNTNATAGKYWQVGPDSSVSSFVIYNQSGAGVYMTNGGTSWNANSDVRLKTNIQTLGADSGLAAIEQINPVTFNWKDVRQTGIRLGFIAQDVQKVFPELVSTSGTTTIMNADGTQQIINDTLGLDYTGMIVPAIKGIQELDVRTQAQQTEIKSLNLNLNSVGLLDATSTPAADFADRHPGFVETIRQVLAKLGIAIRNGVASLTGLEIGSPQKPSGITIYDQATGEPYCVGVRNGAMAQTKGKCGEVQAPPASPTDSGASVGAPQNTVFVDPATLTPEIIPPVSVTTASTTETESPDLSANQELIVKPESAAAPSIPVPEETPVTSTDSVAVQP
jgi:hypothetical protein